MLLEADKRGDHLDLLYSKEKFSVPNNVHIIGMMNTADRSLAIVDYALRRRFAFFDLMPAFETESFTAYLNETEFEPLQKLVAAVQQLNSEIAADPNLGEGFYIGHSFFSNFTKNALDLNTLDDVVEYELIPLLKEYWFDDSDKQEAWAAKLKGVLR